MMRKPLRVAIAAARAAGLTVVGVSHGSVIRLADGRSMRLPKGNHVSVNYEQIVRDYARRIARDARAPS